MARSLTLDFSKSTPVAGTQRDKIPPGNYLLVCKKVTDPEFKFKSGTPGIVCNFVVAHGPETGKRLVDQFALPQKAEDSTFGIDKFYTMLLAMQIPIPNRKVKFDLDSVVGRQVMAVVGDNSYKDQKGVERTNSQINEYVLPAARVASQQAADDDETDDDSEIEEEEAVDDDGEFFADEAADDVAEDDVPDDQEYAEDEEDEDAPFEEEEEEVAPPPPPPARRPRAAPRPVQAVQAPAAAAPRRQAAPVAATPTPARRPAPAAANGGGNQLRRRPAQAQNDGKWPFNS